MNEELIIDEKEMVGFIVAELADKNVSKEVVEAVLGLEFEFLKLKGVIE